MGASQRHYSGTLFICCVFLSAFVWPAQIGQGFCLCCLFPFHLRDDAQTVKTVEAALVLLSSEMIGLPS
jgi:hypothetical protein